MSTRVFSAAAGIGLQTKNVPDLMIARTITARADAMQPLAIAHRCWNLDFGGHGMQRARKRIESRLIASKQDEELSTSV